MSELEQSHKDTTVEKEGKKNKEPILQMSNQSKKPANWFVRFMIFLFVCFLAGLVLTSFLKQDPPYNITSEIVFVLLIMTVLILSESFNNMNIGKILTLSNEVEKTAKEKEEVKRENSDLRSSLIQITGNLQQSQVNTTIQAPGAELSGLFKLGVTKAEKEEDLQEDEEGEKDKIRRKVIRTQAELSTNYAFEKYLDLQNISSQEVIKDIQFTKSFKGVDLVSDLRVVFDGFLNTPHYELFFETQLHNGFTRYFETREIYVKLSKILSYRRAKSINAKLVLIVAKWPEDVKHPYSDKTHNTTELMLETFQPAIANNLLEVEVIEFSKEEYENLLQKAEEIIGIKKDNETKEKPKGKKGKNSSKK